VPGSGGRAFLEFEGRGRRIKEGYTLKRKLFCYVLIFRHSFSAINRIEAKARSRPDQGEVLVYYI